MNPDYSRIVTSPKHTSTLLTVSGWTNKVSTCFQPEEEATQHQIRSVESLNAHGMDFSQRHGSPIPPTRKKFRDAYTQSSDEGFEDMRSRRNNESREPQPTLNCLTCKKFAEIEPRNFEAIKQEKNRLEVKVVELEDYIGLLKNGLTNDSPYLTVVPSDKLLLSNGRTRQYPVRVATSGSQTDREQKCRRCDSGVQTDWEFKENMSVQTDSAISICSGTQTEADAKPAEFQEMQQMNADLTFENTHLLKENSKLKKTVATCQEQERIRTTQLEDLKTRVVKKEEELARAMKSLHAQTRNIEQLQKKLNHYQKTASTLFKEMETQHEKFTQIRTEFKTTSEGAELCRKRLCEVRNNDAYEYESPSAACINS